MPEGWVTKIVSKGCGVRDVGFNWSRHGAWLYFLQLPRDPMSYLPNFQGVLEAIVKDVVVLWRHDLRDTAKSAKGC